jgi:uncharacterized protein (TIGR00251 family)
VAVIVKPRSTRVGVEVESDGRIVVRVHAPAAEGAANRECLALLAEALGTPKSSVSIVRGERSRAKQIVVANLTASEVQGRLPRARGEA